MKTTSVTLDSHFEEFVRASILSGKYGNASEVVLSGLRLLESQERECRLSSLRAAIAEGENSGYLKDFDFDAHLKTLGTKQE